MCSIVFCLSEYTCFFIIPLGLLPHLISPFLFLSTSSRQPPLSPQTGDQPVAYLCGQAPHCSRIGTTAALAQAKTNVELFYPVVGVLEQLGRPSNCVYIKLWLRLRTSV